MSTDTRLALVELVQSKLPDVRAALPPGTIEAERLEVAFRSAFNKTPKLTECTPMSICAALVNCAMLGIIPNTPEQHAYLIPRKNECNLEIGYRGFVHLILRDGTVSHVESGVVHKGDTYEFQKGEPVICRHSPNLETPNRDAQPIIAAYCLVVFKSGAKRLELMDSGELGKIERAMLRQNFDKASPAWKEWRSEMLRKAPIKRIAKTLSLGPCLATAAELDNRQFQQMRPEPPAITLPSGDTVPVLTDKPEPATVSEGGEFKW